MEVWGVEKKDIIFKDDGTAIQTFDSDLFFRIGSGTRFSGEFGCRSRI
jgi:hypothetical protein